MLGTDRIAAVVGVQELHAKGQQHLENSFFMEHTTAFVLRWKTGQIPRLIKK